MFLNWASGSAAVCPVHLKREMVLSNLETWQSIIDLKIFLQECVRRFGTSAALLATHSFDHITVVLRSGMKQEERREGELWGMLFNNCTRLPDRYCWVIKETAALFTAVKKKKKTSPLLMQVLMEANCLIGALSTADGGYWIIDTLPLSSHVTTNSSLMDRASLPSFVCYQDFTDD